MCSWRPALQFAPPLQGCAGTSNFIYLQASSLTSQYKLSGDSGLALSTSDLSVRHCWFYRSIFPFTNDIELTLERPVVSSFADGRWFM